MEAKQHMTRKIVFALIACSFVAAPTFAVMTLRITNSYGTTGGGEFLLKPTNIWPFVPASLGEAAGKFESFCIEKNEYIRFRTEFYAVLNTGAVNGGPGAGGFDPLDPMTAYLYDQFITENLTGYDYTHGPGRAASANALQHVIWYIEDEEGMSWIDGNGSLRDKFYQDALTNNTGSIGDVRILNLYSSRSRNRRDQLVKVPRTPAPSAVILGSLGAVMVGWLRKRRTL